MALYFAYGSNMATARLRAHAASARPLGAARLDGYAWRCDKQSIDGTARANLTQDADAEAWGVLFELEGADLETLDRSEGGYARVTIVVQLGEAETREAYTYVSERLCDDVLPADWYLALIIAGAREHELPDARVRSLEASIHAPTSGARAPAPTTR